VAFDKNPVSKQFAVAVRTFVLIDVFTILIHHIESDLEFCYNAYKNICDTFCVRYNASCMMEMMKSLFIAMREEAH